MMIKHRESSLPSILLDQNLIDRINDFAYQMNVSQEMLVSLAIKEFIDRYEVNQNLLERINRANEDFPDENEKHTLDQMRNCHRNMIQEEAW
jgi:hypothetical protein